MDFEYYSKYDQLGIRLAMLLLSINNVTLDQYSYSSEWLLGVYSGFNHLEKY